MSSIKGRGLGGTVGSLNSIKDFGVRALYSFSKYVLPRLNNKDQVIINKLIKLLSTSSDQLDNLITNNTEIFSMAYDILKYQVDLPPTLTNYAGITLGKIGDILFPDEDEDEDEDVYEQMHKLDEEIDEKWMKSDIEQQREPTVPPYPLPNGEPTLTGVKSISMENKYVLSTDEKVAIAQNALDKYIVSDTSIGGNYRRDALLLTYDLSSASWNDIFDIPNYLLLIIVDALRRLHENNPNNDYENMLQEIYDFIDNE